MFKKVSITSLVLLLNLFISCKKGENDPKISLRTRKIRVEGEWIMKKGNASLTFNDPKATSFNQSFVMDGVKSTIYETQPANTGYYYYYVINYSFSINFKKDGTFTCFENFGGKVLEATGIWNFMGAIGEEKNKESIIIKIDNVSRGYTRDNLFNKTNTEVIYKLTELRNKKMTLLSLGKPYIDANGKSASFSCEYFLEQR